MMQGYEFDGIPIQIQGGVWKIQQQIVDNTDTKKLIEW